MVNHMQNNQTSPRACSVFWHRAAVGIPSLDLRERTLTPTKAPVPINLALFEPGPAEIMCMKCIQVEQQPAVGPHFTTGKKK